MLYTPLHRHEIEAETIPQTSKSWLSTIYAFPTNDLGCWPPQRLTRPGLQVRVCEPTRHPQKPVEGTRSTVPGPGPSILHLCPPPFPLPSQFCVDAVVHDGHALTVPLGDDTIYPAYVPATTLDAAIPNPVFLNSTSLPWYQPRPIETCSKLYPQPTELPPHIPS